MYFNIRLDAGTPLVACAYLFCNLGIGDFLLYFLSSREIRHRHTLDQSDGHPSHFDDRNVVLDAYSVFLVTPRGQAASGKRWRVKAHFLIGLQLRQRIHPIFIVTFDDI